MGAADPTSGTVSLHEVVRGINALLRSGWRPLRTIVFASWDCEEVGIQYCVGVYYTKGSSLPVWFDRKHRVGGRLPRMDLVPCRSVSESRYVDHTCLQNNSLEFD